MSLVTGNAGGGGFGGGINPYTVTFTGALASQGIAAITGTPTGTSGMNAKIVTATVQAGGIFQDAMFTGAIAVDPVNPQTIYLGTGDTNNSTDAYYGTGIYVSYNSGTTWTLLTDDTSGTPYNPFNGKGISQILIATGGANPTLYVADGDGGSGKNEIQTADSNGFSQDTTSNGMGYSTTGPNPYPNGRRLSQ